MQELDSDSDVIDWESEFITIQYEFSGSLHRYVPDFKVTRTNSIQLIEVKPQSLRNIPRNIAKRLAAKEYCLKKGMEYIEWEPTLIFPKMEQNHQRPL